MKRFLYIFLFFSFLIISVTVYFITSSFPVSPKNTATKTFIVNQGDGIKSIALRLESNGFIKNRFVFIIHAYLLGLNKKLQAGSFQLAPSYGTSIIVNKLSQGGRFDVWFKIIDGQRNEEVALNLPEFINQKAFLLVAKENIGRLYPDSYLLPIDTSLDELLSIVNRNFDNKMKEVKKDAQTEFSDQQLVILASLVEREARTLVSKQMVAGILLNRLKINMPLQVDASVQYAKDSRLPSPKDYWQPITKKDLSIVSPFNTYQNQGLPPSPICNPGFDSLSAVYHPTTSDYLFYITGHDNQMHYATTLDEHNTNIIKYLQ